MPIAIVDALEMVDVHHDDGEPFASASRVLKGPVSECFKAAAIKSLGKEMGLRQHFQLRDELPALREVAKIDNHPGYGCGMG